MERLRVMLCVLLLAPFAAVAQDEPVVEEEPAEEATAPEPAPAEAAPAEGTPPESPAEAPAVEEVSAEEAEEEEPAEALPGSFVEAFYVPTTALTTKVPASTTERGDGFGARGLYRIFKWLAVAGEYQQRTLDDSGDDLADSSAGLGFTVHSDAGDLAGVFFEYDKFDSDSVTLDGYSVHARLARQQNEWFSFHAGLGFLALQDDAEDHEGAEFSFGVGVGPRWLRGVAEWRFLDLEGEDSGQRTQLADVRVGVRFSF